MSTTASPPADPSVREERVLRQRAQELARKTAVEVDPQEQFEVVEFEIGGERYGLKLEEVKEVCALRELTPVPTAPSFVLGIINRRGEIHAVVDLRKFLGLTGAPLCDLSRALVLADDEMRVAVLADRILGVRVVAFRELQPVTGLSGGRADYTRGITQDRLLLLSAPRIFADPRLIVNCDR